MTNFIELFRLTTILLGKLAYCFTFIVCVSMLKDIDWNIRLTRDKDNE